MTNEKEGHFTGSGFNTAGTPTTIGISNNHNGHHSHQNSGPSGSEKNNNNYNNNNLLNNSNNIANSKKSNIASLNNLRSGMGISLSRNDSLMSSSRRGQNRTENESQENVKAKTHGHMKTNSCSGYVTSRSGKDPKGLVD